MATEALRVGLAAGDWLGWQGGLNYYRNLLAAIEATPACRVEPVLFVGRKFDEKAISHFARHELVRTAIFDRGSARWLARAAGRRAMSRDPLFERVLARYRVGVLSHTYQPWRSRRIGVVGWIPDLQHFRMPEFFPPSELAQRDRRFKQICESSTLVIVSSEASRSDVAEFAPEHRAKVRVLTFAVDPPRLSELPSREELAARYSLPEPYFHLPNQFWPHKNHALVVDALGILRDRGISATVISTGKTESSPGAPDLFADIARRAAAQGVGKCFRPLGLVPHGDVTALMRDSAAVINPSHFEGWSTPVEEAKALGKRVLLSDIAVHREQAPADAIYFDPTDPDALAAAIESSLRSFAESPAPIPAAIDLRPSSQEEFALGFEKIITEAAERVGREREM